MTLHEAMQTTRSLAQMAAFTQPAVRVTLEGMLSSAPRIAFRGPTGTHSLDVHNSTPQRVLIHFRGFLQNTAAFLSVR